MEEKRLTKAERYELDYERLANTLWTEYRNEIVDKDTYNESFDDYMGELNDKQNNKLRNQTWDKLKDDHPRKIKPYSISEHLYGKRAKGQNALRGVYIPPKKARVSEANYPQFGITKKGAVIRARTETIKVKNKPITIHRDIKGRFVSVKK